MQHKIIYLDNAATTRMSETSIAVMLEAIRNDYANSSSVHTPGNNSRLRLEAVRRNMLSTLSPSASGSLIFTSGGSESDNLALKGIMEFSEKRHIITSSIEHNAVLRTCKYLERRGCSVTYLDPDPEGVVRPSDVEAAITPDTALISIMYANNEVGTIQPIREIGEIAHRHGILFHTDAVQAYAQVPIDVDDCQIDLLSASAHKFRGPKGVGFLYVRDGIDLEPLLHGGGHEGGLRSGTVNVPGICAMGAAAGEAISKMDMVVPKLTEMRDAFIDRILKEIPCTKLNGSRVHRLPNNVNVSFPGYPAGKLLDILDRDGICVSTGSACSSGTGKASHVLTAMGLSESRITGSLRMTLSDETTWEELEVVVGALKRAMRQLEAPRSVNIFSINI